MIIGVPKEICPGERRVALTPANVATLLKKKEGVQILVEKDAGQTAGFTDAAYEQAGAKIVDRDTIFSDAQAVLLVQTAGSNTENGDQDME